MAECFDVTSEGYLKLSNVVDVSDCLGFVVVTRDEYLQFSNTNLVTILQTLFEFDLAIFSQVCGMGYLMFLVSHGAGNVTRWLGRA